MDSNCQPIPLSIDHIRYGRDCEFCIDHLDQIKAMLSCKMPVSVEDLQEALAHAAYVGDADTVKWLLANNLDLTYAVFMGAILGCNPAVFQEFVNHGWDVNSLEFDDPGLRLVVSSEACVRWFLDHGADPNLAGSYEPVTPLTATILLEQSIAVLELLISRGAKVESEALFHAIHLPDDHGIPYIKALLDHGADVNYFSDEQGTPLQVAARYGAVNTIRFLLDHGADCSRIDSIGQTATEYAQMLGFSEAFELLSSYETEKGLRPAQNPSSRQPAETG